MKADWKSYGDSLGLEEWNFVHGYSPWHCFQAILLVLGIVGFVI